MFNTQPDQYEPAGEDGLLQTHPELLLNMEQTRPNASAFIALLEMQERIAHE